MSNATALIGAFLLIAGVILLVYPQNIGGYYATPTCGPEGVTLAVTPSTVGAGQSVQLSGSVYPVSGLCSLNGSPVYLAIFYPSGGALFSQVSTLSSSSSGEYNGISLMVPNGYSGSMNAEASLCGWTNADQTTCTNQGFHNAVVAITVSASPPPTYSVTVTFTSPGGNVISGVSAVLISGITQVASGTSNSEGIVTFVGISNGLYTVSFQPSCCYSNGVENLNVNGANVAGTVSLSSITSATTTTSSSSESGNASLYPILPAGLILIGVIMIASGGRGKR